MMTNPCYPNLIGPQNIPIYGVSEGGIHPNSSSSSTHPTSFLYNLSVLKDKVHQLQSLASIFLSPDQNHESTAIATSTVGTVVQEIIVTASSMMFACQQMSQNNSSFELHANHRHNSVVREEERAPSTTFFAAHHDAVEHNWYGDQGFNPCNNDSNNNNSRSNSEDGYRKELLSPVPRENERDGGGDAAATAKNYDIIELDAADLLAKYTHYCQVCGKGFKRDANLRMHMRAHGDEYKTSAALSNPVKNGGGGGVAVGRKYSCPQEGCRWNKKHTRFQPLKSMICVKNHYKRSHCPKMYVCKRCNRKQFSVLSDLRTHEKHCGDLKWQCSCGTTFSRKDKLMGHVALFVGHAPVVAAALPNGSEVVENS